MNDEFLMDILHGFLKKITTLHARYLIGKDAERKGMDTRTGRSMFDPYYPRIQELLFSGMSIKETHDYVEKYFGTHSTYAVFWAYVKRRKLDWFMPGKA